MIKRSLASAVMSLSLAAAGSAQSPPADDVPMPPVCQPAETPALGLVEYVNREQAWVGADYLHWWMRGQRLSVPVVGTATGVGSFGDDFVTPLSLSNLQGPGSLGTIGVSGLRLTAGLWLDNDNTLGLEASGFVFDTSSQTSRFASGPSGSPFLGIPFVDAVGAQQVAVISIPAGFPGNAFAGGETGSVSTSATTQFWGAEGNGVATLSRSDDFRLEALAGFRFLDLRDRFEVATSGAGFGAIGPIFANTGGIFATDRLNTIDSFSATNHFYGGQAGLRSQMAFGDLSLGISGKVALGAMHQRVESRGSGTLDRAVLPDVTLARGYFTGPSNSFARTQDKFCVIPDVEFKAGYQLTNWLRLTAGYNFLYVSSVARAADQLDNRLPAAQSFRSGAFIPGATTGVPRSDIQTTSFWAHGLNAGLEMRW